MLKTQLYRLTIFLVGQLPLNVVRSLGALLGSLAWLTRSRMWLVSKENIELCYPNLDPHRQHVLARQSLRETGKTLSETCFAWTRPSDQVLAKIQRVHGKEQVDRQHTAGTGIVFVIPHQGNWEVINHFLGCHYGLTHMYQPNRNEALNHYIQTKRGTTGTQFVPTNSRGIKAQLRALKSGQCIGVMPDQEPLVHTGSFANFFGIPALTNELVAGYRRTDCAFFVAVCERTVEGFEVRFEPIDNRVPADQFIPQVNDAIEKTIRRHPEQYLWSYKRFRTRPEGELDYYQFEQHPVRTLVESVALKLYLLFSRNLPHRVCKFLAVLVSRSPFLAKRKKITRINLKLTSQSESLNRVSMGETILSAFEAPRVWHLPPDSFETLLELSDQTVDVSNGCLVLTPPLGNREVLMRFLASKGQVTEYYHSNTLTSLDQMIRAKRTGMGVKLAEHDQHGRDYIVSCLQAGQIATLCPDQQPRLRGGLFVPLFGQPALTTLAIPTFLRQTGCSLYLGTAIRVGSKFRVQLVKIEYDLRATDETLLTLVNRHLEDAIMSQPEQYRWSDKRFNIQPRGQKKVYR